MSPFLTENPVADFGVTVIETDIDRLVLSAIRTWLPTYLAEAERQRELPARLLARPDDSAYQSTLDDTEFPDGKLPAIVATTASAGSAERRQEGAYSAEFEVAVSAIVRGRTPAETRAIAAVFGGCIRSLLVHQQLEDLDGELHWLEGGVIPVPDATDRGRWLAAGSNTFVVYADTVLSGSGPITPDGPFYPEPDPSDPDTPYDPLSTVWRAVTDVTPKED